MSPDYYAMFRDLVTRYDELTHERNEIDRETAKVSQLLKAIFPLLPGDKQEMFQGKVEEMENSNLTLAQAIRRVFQAKSGEWLTPPAIREYVKEIGFSFSGYASNPLSSITNTLKRMVPGELEIELRDNGRTAYRLKPCTVRREGRHFAGGHQIAGQTTSARQQASS